MTAVMPFLGFAMRPSVVSRSRELIELESCRRASPSTPWASSMIQCLMGGQDAVVDLHVAKQKRVVGDDDVGTHGRATRAVQVTPTREEGAAFLEAVVGICLDVSAGKARPPDAEGVEVAVAGLRREAEERGNHRDEVAIGALAAAYHVLELAQAQVVVVALEGDVVQVIAKRRAQAGKVLVDELVHEGVGLGRDTHRDLVLACAVGDGHEVGHGLADARSRLDDADVTFAQARCNLLRHSELLGALLVTRVHRAHDAFRRKRRLDARLVAKGEGNLVGVRTGRLAQGLRALCAVAAQGEVDTGLLERRLREVRS